MSIETWILSNGDNLQVVLFFVLLTLFAVAERLMPRRRGSLDRWRRWPANFFLTLLNLIAMGALPVSFVGAAIWAERNGWGVLNAVQLPAVTLIIVTLGVRGFISFSTHYLMHMVPLLWRVHRVHHLDTEFDVSTTVRFHPLEFFIQWVPGVLIVVGFGLSPSVLMVYELLDVAVTLWSHSNLRLPIALDRILHYVIVTPDLHRVHHSAWKPETNSNFGAVFPIWDLVFGTFRGDPRDGHEQMRLGLDDLRGAAAHQPVWLLMSPLAEDLRPWTFDLRRSVKRSMTKENGLRTKV
jgi:sterol desaturase/sphingolipid hydroxylase (fatty acid hydroxylase superfamily)